MSQALEAGMLLCFGISWPMSLIKNIKSHTAKNMSIGFIVLIITGYISGIVAKLYSHTYGYVLAVYLLNLLIVSLNLVVYFVNRRLDRKAADSKALEEELNMRLTSAAATLKEDISEQLNEYSEQNITAEANGIVFFGSSRYSDIEMSERARDLDIAQPVYNRSIHGLTIDSSFGALNECVYDLNPAQILVGIGEDDMTKDGFNVSDFIEDYRWLLYELHRSTNSKIFIVSVVSPLSIADEVNAQLKLLAEDTGCTYMDITQILDVPHPDIKLMELLRMFTRTHPITFYEAMKIGNE